MAAPLGGSPLSPQPPRVGEGQDVLARWTDGLLYLGVVKKVDVPRRGCLIQFEDNSQFFVLWKDISPAAVPGDDPRCCVCSGSSRSPEDVLVRCGKCRHAYHQRCHVPPPPGGAAPWSCRRCVFAVATKRGGALRRGPQARAMLRMKSVLPYALANLDWDPPHLHNLQHCYCYCGGPGHWNLKMLQCRQCSQWFHEACTQCLSKPLLYGDRFYMFECSVCRGGAESVRRLPLRWVDVAHLLLYHLSVCCKKKYFDLEREILPFANSNWEALLLGQLSATPKSERYGRLLGALSSNKDRFVSGREMKKRKGLFGLHTRAPPPLPPHLLEKHRNCQRHLRDSCSPGRGKAGGRRRSQVSPGGSYNFRQTQARRAPPSPPIRMFASFHPSASNSPSSPAPDPDPPSAPPPARRRPLPPPRPRPSPAKAPPTAQTTPTAQDMFAAQATPTSQTTPPSLAPPPGLAPPPRVLARRVTLDGTVQYLLEWGGGAML